MTVEQQKQHRKRQLTLQYMVAVSLIFLVSLSSLLVLKQILEQQEGYATVINMSGRQRMLSQQIALLTHEIVAEQQAEGKEYLHKQIRSATKLMKQSHQQLISGKGEDGTGVVLSDTLSTMYFHSPLEVDRLVDEYLAAVTALMEEPDTANINSQLSYLSKTARGELLHALDAVVKQYETESARYTDILRDSALVIFLLMVLLLGLIILFGFRPMANLVAENESMLNSILDSTPTLMDIVSKDGTILYQSKYLLDLLGESTIGQKCFEAYKTDSTKCEACPVGNGELVADLKITTCFDRLGVGAVIEMTHLPLLFKGEEAVLHTFQDITEQKKTETFLIMAKEEADRASELKSNFLANMSHEIRTPMNAIIGFSDLALETALTAQQQDYVEKINSSSHSLLGIINRILDFSKIEAGKLSLEKTQFSLEEILQNITHLFADKAREKNVTFITEQHADIPALLVGDALRLQQILTNLVANSLKFTDRGEIIVTVKLEALSDEQARLQFSVEDTGIGIDEDKLATLFDAFSQADSSTTRKYGGTGLGLAISRQLVELLGGSIDVSSTKGVSTIFRFTVPFGLHSVIKQNLEADISEEETISKESPGAASTSHSPERRQEDDRRKRIRDRRKNAADDSLPEKLDGIELKEGLARLEGNSGLYLRLLKEFALQNASMGKKLKRALEQQDQEYAERLVHTIKGTAGSLGVLELAAVSLTLEQAMKEDKGVEGQMTQFEAALQRVLHSLDTLTETQEQVQTGIEGVSAFDKERRSRLMAELRQMLAGKKFQAVAKWQEVKPLLGDVDTAMLLQIDRSLSRFDHSLALELLAKLQIIDEGSV